MSLEGWCMFGAIMLSLVHVSAASLAFKAQVGNRYTVGARDEGLQPQGLAGRLDRAQRNFNETFPTFAVAVLLLLFTGTEGVLSEYGAPLYLGARIAYLPLYASGVPWLRTFGWNFATLGLVLVAIDIVV